MGFSGAWGLLYHLKAPCGWCDTDGGCACNILSSIWPTTNIHLGRWTNNINNLNYAWAVWPFHPLIRVMKTLQHITALLKMKMCDTSNLTCEPTFAQKFIHYSIHIWHSHNPQHIPNITVHPTHQLGHYWAVPTCISIGIMTHVLLVFIEFLGVRLVSAWVQGNNVQWGYCFVWGGRQWRIGDSWSHDQSIDRLQTGAL